jgi:putative two-component system response regulator
MPDRILIIDDSEAIRTLMVQMLRSLSLEIATAEDGVSGLEEFARNRPDMVLLDVEMPRMDGFEVCRRIKSDPETRLIPVVLITGLSDTEDRVRGIQAGADDFLTKPVERSELLARVRSLLSLKRYTDDLDRAESVLLALARSIEGKDPYTEGHCERLANFSRKLGRRLGLPEEQLLALWRGGIVHDIGKIAVPDAILLKPGPLSPEELTVMRLHVVVGERICSPLRSFRLILPIIRSHHEKWDGSGYPDGLQGEQIPLLARILQVVDVFDALTTDRPYRTALAPRVALDAMAKEVERGWWDTRIFTEFQKMMLEAER